jgi:predicted nucleotidyltransferase
MGLPPIRIEILTAVSGVQFRQCYTARETVVIEGVKVDFISLEHLKANKRAAGRHQDFSGLEHLP